MKRFLMLLTSCLVVSFGAVQAQSLGGVGKVINTIAGHLGSMDLEGTWDYAGSAVSFKSENFLMKAGGAVAAGAIEKNLDEQFAKLGIKPGSSRYEFKSDDKFTHTIGSRKLRGTYSYNADTGYITLKYMRLVPVKAKVSGSAHKMELLFDSSEFLTLISFLGGISGSGAVKAITSLVNSYDGMMVGFELKKR